MMKSSEFMENAGKLFLYFSDEMTDITWIQAFQMLLQMFRLMLISLQSSQLLQMLICQMFHQQILLADICCTPDCQGFPYMLS